MASPYPLRTARLTLRFMRSTDAEVHAAYRNDPQIAQHQLWDLPYTVEQAVASLQGQDDRADLEPGDWNTLAIELDGRVIGDVVTNLHETRGVAEIGFTLARDHHGHGYATEAATALVEDLVERLGVGRVYGELDPVNTASQRVLERVGLVFESETRRSFLWRGEWTDNMSYAATAEGWRTWRDRPQGPPTELAMVPLTPDNQHRYAALATHHSQRRFVAPVAQSYGDALFPEEVNGAPVVPRLWGLAADGEPAGFLMIADVTEAHPEPFLWRLLIDRMHQRRGIGRLALDQLTALLRAEGCRSLLTSWESGPGGPRPFYLRYGFVETGRVVDDESEARLLLDPPRRPVSP